MFLVCILPGKAVRKMTYTVSGGTLNPTHSLSHDLCLAEEASAPSGSAETPPLRLSDIALALHGDWLMMATPLAITSSEVIKIQKEFGNVTEQVAQETQHFFLLFMLL